MGSCSTNDGAGPCTFDDVSIGDENICLIHNEAEPVQVDVSKEWLYDEDVGLYDEAIMKLVCQNVDGGDGEYHQDDMRWVWGFQGDQTHTAWVVPNRFGTTRCRVIESITLSAVESINDCDEWQDVDIGDDLLDCTVINSVFFEGIPTLSQYGLILLASLMLLIGAVAARRI